MSPSPNIGGTCPPCPIWIDAPAYLSVDKRNPDNDVQRDEKQIEITTQMKTWQKQVIVSSYKIRMHSRVAPTSGLHQVTKSYYNLASSRLTPKLKLIKTRFCEHRCRTSRRPYWQSVHV